MKEKMHGVPLEILLVEDNPAHAELVMRSFEQNLVANRITHLADGRGALDYLFQQGEYKDADIILPHMVLLDLRLPKIDGLDVLKQIKQDQVLKKLPVIILTTSAAEKDVAMAYEFHANSYIVKPMDYEQLVKLMGDLGYYWMVWNFFPWEFSSDSLELDYDSKS